ncbi:hypothetical protein JG687_00010547, partial [Phytophthora cactorum]
SRNKVPGSRYFAASRDQSGSKKCGSTLREKFGRYGARRTKAPDNSSGIPRNPIYDRVPFNHRLFGGFYAVILLLLHASDDATSECSFWTATIEMKCVLFLSSLVAGVVNAAKYPLGPNRFLGTCLDSAWVTQMEAERVIDSQDRDLNGRLVHPFLQPALKYPRHRVDDPRTSSGKVFTDNCMASDELFYGAYQDADGKNRGEVNGTLVLDLCAWDTHALATMVLAIMAEEVSGYKISINKGGAGVDITERMSSVGSGKCTPTHLNVEVWTS